MLSVCFKSSSISNAMSSSHGGSEGSFLNLVFFKLFLLLNPTIVELLVHMDCEGCEKRIRRAISKLQGVDSFEVDMEKQKVTVVGYVEKRKVLKVVRRTGRKAEFWPFPYDSEYYPYAAQYLDESTFSSTYNYYVHGYNESVHGYFPNLPYSVPDDLLAYCFSEENVKACTIM